MSFVSCLFYGLADAAFTRSITFIHPSLPTPDNLAKAMRRWAIPDVYNNLRWKIPQKAGRLVLNYDMTNWQDDVEAISWVNDSTSSEVRHLIESKC
jgi:hypothetical protein